ncbi:9987_t:CDS:10 [Ambispora gerdemannii]|uniref:factor independent urate hydroxylase n=1 Tax=Ambispora gerdemannii TaxID=144530 RepID=A0A9N9A9R3_9GLOM|nr:9987_t:CDS:10 [Ambispora gerdemannii]
MSSYLLSAKEFFAGLLDLDVSNSLEFIENKVLSFLDAVNVLFKELGNSPGSIAKVLISVAVVVVTVVKVLVATGFFQKTASVCLVKAKSIRQSSLHIPRTLIWHAYVWPFVGFYLAWLYIYLFAYDELLVSEEWTFLTLGSLITTNALLFLSCQWSVRLKALFTCKSVLVNDIYKARVIKIIPAPHKGKGEICPLYHAENGEISFQYQKRKYIWDEDRKEFYKLAYPSDAATLLHDYQNHNGLQGDDEINATKEKYGFNRFEIPVPTFRELFKEHAVAPFFVFQLFCVGLWMMDEYWYFSVFTLFMLVMFESTVVFQRLRTLAEFRTMSIKPYSIHVRRNLHWITVNSDELLPGDLVSIVRSKEDSGVPCDMLIIHGSCIVNEAMLSGESTPLLKESIALRDGNDILDMNSIDKNSILFGGTKVLQVTPPAKEHPLSAPDNGCIAYVIRTGFGTAQGKLVRTMVYSTEHVSANNLESFLFILFLLVFALTAAGYVWIKGVENDRKRSKLLLNCIIIVTSVVPPELPMELSLAVNTSLVALARYAIYCTEPFRIPFAGKIDVCAFDKTGTLTGENLVVEGIAGIHPNDPKILVSPPEALRETIQTLAAAHALVLLDDGIVGDPMEKATLEALEWKLLKGDIVAPDNSQSARFQQRSQLQIRRRFQFSSALKRMSSVSTLSAPRNSKTFVAVKGAPETLRHMYVYVPDDYEDTYKFFTRRGSRVLALGYKYLTVNLNSEEINNLTRESVESKLNFAGFLIFHCPLKDDAISTLTMLNESAHRCVMITGDNPLTACHVAETVKIIERDVLILDLREEATSDDDLIWKSVDEKTIIPVNPVDPIDPKIYNDYDLCVTGAALSCYENKPHVKELLARTWVYARVSPGQKEFILSGLKQAGYTTLMCGDGTNDVGALKQAHIGVALLDGTIDDLKKIAEHQKTQRLKDIRPPPQVDRLAEQLLGDLDEEPPTIKLGDASVAAPFTSKLANVSAIRQGRCTLVATIQMYKILALNCLISAYSLSVLHLEGIKYGDLQATISGMMQAVCFLCISKAKPLDKLSKERPQANVFNFYIILSILGQFAIHIAALVYVVDLVFKFEAKRIVDVDSESEFEPSLLNTAVYLIALSMQVSTFAINYQGHPFRESLRENTFLYYGLLGVGAIAIAGATEFVPELNSWLSLVPQPFDFKTKLTATMLLDFGLAWVVEIICKFFFAHNKPKAIARRISISKSKTKSSTTNEKKGKYRIQQNADYGHELAAAASTVLASSMVPRSIKNPKPIPLTLSILSVGSQQYGKDRVRLVKVIRNGDWHEVVELTIRVLLEGGFEEAYTKADNSLVIATDSIKNTVYILAKKSAKVQHIELFAIEIGDHFISQYSHVSTVHVSIIKHRWTRMLIDGKLHNHSFLRDGDYTRSTRVIASRNTGVEYSVMIDSGLKDLLVLKTTGSAFHSFVRDKYTTLEETDDRILSTSIDATWTFKIPNSASITKIPFDDIYASIRDVTLKTFSTDNSASVQATLYLMAKQALEKHPELESVSYALPNKHHFAFDLERFGLKNSGKDADIFVPFSDPSGLITATIARAKL